MCINEEMIEVNGHSLLLRNANEEDAEMILQYLRTICEETRFLVKEPEEITLSIEEERKFISKQNESEHNLMLLGFLDGIYVGNCSLMGMELNRFKHRATIGIALFKKYTGIGIGRVMIEKLISVAKGNGIEQIELEVVTDNVRAISLYKRIGFEIWGTFPRNMKYKNGTYADTYWMMKKL